VVNFIFLNVGKIFLKRLKRVY